MNLVNALRHLEHAVGLLEMRFLAQAKQKKWPQSINTGLLQVLKHSVQ